MDPLAETTLRKLTPQKANLSLTWTDISVYIKSTKFKCYRYVTTKKQVIYNGAGAIHPGQIVALMGPSGSGKTTLLTALAYRYQGGTLVKGDVKLNGKKVDRRMRSISGFMFQEDFFLKVLTVREHLTFTAKLKMSRYSTNAERSERVEALLDAFMLRKIEDSYIGGIPQQGEKAIISGGERRRLSLATAMINLPKLIFADEPTTGLDSFNALQIVQTLKTVSKNTGAPVICSIHQPMPEIFTLFDKIMLLAEGRLMFSGTPEESVEFYENAGFIEEHYMSHPEFIVKCVSPPQGAGEAENAKQMEILSRKFFKSSYYANHKASIVEIKTSEQGTSCEIYSFIFKGPFTIKKIFVLILRNMIVQLREPEKQWLSIGEKFILAVVSGLCVSGLTRQLDQDAIQGIQGVLFLLVTENTYASMYNVIYMFPKEYPQFITEYYNNTYSTTAYYIAKAISCIPGYILEAIAYTLTVYIMAGLRNSLYALVMTIITASLCIIVSASFGTLFSCFFSDLQTAVTYMVPFDYLMLITAGMFIRLGSINWAVQWLKYCSWFYYAYESYTIIQWEGVQYIDCPKNDTYTHCLTNGAQVISEYNFDTDHFLMNIICLLALYVLLHILGLAFFIRKIRKLT
ncbi:protein scarlet-like [Cimex lectularius]|uniref:ABC transporter domain-containing protein n=1 Tax=Cimex lectularius TaxID=79782 RepID=A0A8I6RDW9_CIMLE|nr:protein scarlet-like [Cimex lectularius]